MQYEYGVAPITYTNGIPTYKAGEWEGKLSCKFHSYKRIIRPKDHGIIYNQFEPTFVPKRKLLGPGNSPEFVFRPSCKMVSGDFERIVKPKGLKYINFKTEPRKLLVQKKHIFPYKIQMEKDNNERLNTLPNSKIIRNEVKMLMEENGYHQKDYFTIYNKDLNNLNFIRNQLNKLSLIADDPYKTARQIKEEKISNRLIKRNNLNNDIQYVEKLNTWDNNLKSHMKSSSTALPNISNRDNKIETENEN